MPVLCCLLQSCSRRWTWRDKTEIEVTRSDRVVSRGTFLHDAKPCFSPQDKWVLTGWQAQVRSWRKSVVEWNAVVFGELTVPARKRDLWPDTKRWAVHPLCKQSTQRHSPQVIPVSLTKGHLGEAAPDLTTACRKRKCHHIQGTHTSSNIHIVNPQRKTTVKHGKVCNLESGKYYNLAQGRYERFPKDRGTWAEGDGRGEMRQGEGIGRETNWSQAGEASFPENLSTKMPAPQKQGFGLLWSLFCSQQLAETST